MYDIYKDYEYLPQTIIRNFQPGPLYRSVNLVVIHYEYIPETN